MSEISEPFPSVTSFPGIAVDQSVQVPKSPARASAATGALGQIRMLKIGFGASVLLAAGYAIVADHGYVASNNAVMSANIVSVRVPIDGYVSMLNVHVASPVTQGAQIGRVEDPRYNDQYLLELRSNLERNLIDAQVSTDVRNQLLREKHQLRTRDSSFLNASTARLQQLETEEEQLVAAKESTRKEALLQFDREKELAKDGIVAQEDLDRVRRQYDVADHDAQAERSSLAAIRTQAKASASGILLDSGTNGVSYAQQRIDDIDIHLAETNRLIAQSTGEAAAAESSIAQVSAHVNLMRAADLVSPVSGEVWKLSSSDGERVATGDTVAQLVDCHASFLVVAIPQDRVPDIEIGGTARFRLSGEKEDRFGKVTSVTGERDEQQDRALAAAPTHERNPTAAVYVSNSDESSGKECLVGRTARVLLPVNHTGMLAQILPRSR